MSASADSPESDRTYEATYASLDRHEVPEWFEDAKLGIFIHWGLYSVPAWATPSAKLGDLEPQEWFRRNPYAEWYLNSMRLEGSPTAEHHRKTYGEDFDYYNFAKSFNKAIADWNPAKMAAIFDETQARYVVLTTKHHDGFTLWPSKLPNPHLPEEQSRASRDIVGELSAAVRARGMRMGLYYSGGIDWSFHPVVIDGTQSGPEVTPPSPEYAAYADGHLRELIDRYQPAIIWNDIRYPGGTDILEIIADYYNRQPDGIINNRWGSSVTVPADFETAEYKQFAEIRHDKWEATRGIGLSFGYNQVEDAEHMLSVEELVRSFIDIVSKNGNLLLNVGPKPDGTIPRMQLERLRGLGQWLKVNGESIFGSRPWIDAEGSLQDDAIDVRFTFKDGTVHAFLLGTPTERKIVIENLIPEPDTRIRLLGQAGDIEWRRNGLNLEIELPDDLPASPAHVLAIYPQPARVMKKRE